MIKKLKWNDAVVNILLIAAVVVALVPFIFDFMHAVSSGSDNSSVTALLGVFQDNADIVPLHDTREIREELDKTAQYYATAVVTTNDTHGYSTKEYADKVLYELFPSGNAIVFLIDMDNRQVYLYTSNNNTVLSTAKCHSITDNVYRYASDGDYTKCIIKTLQQVRKVMSHQSIPEPMKHVSNLLLASTISLMAVFIWANSTTKIKRPGKVYQIDTDTKKKVELNHMNVKQTGSRVIHHSSSSSSGGGFSSGGGCRSGGGGGGGHGGGHGF